MQLLYRISLIVIITITVLFVFDGPEEKQEEPLTISPIININSKEEIMEEKEELPAAEPKTDPAKNNTPPDITETKPHQETAEPTPLILLPISELNEKARAATVNIFCVSKSGGAFEPASGSGVIVDPKGIILTNAHVAQYFLLKDYLAENFINCDIRTGDIAKPAYKAEILYISPLWIEENAKNITLERPKGVGENDFAFLLIIESTIKEKTLPTKFPYLMPGISENISIELPVLLTSYPAGLLGGINIVRELGLLSTLSTIKELFTFSEESSENLDLVSLGGNIAAQSGSSGGAVISRTSGELISLITTNTNAATTDEDDLRAITLSHIDRSLQKQTGEDLAIFLAKDPQETSRVFHETEFDRLKKLLEEVLKGKN